MTGWDEVLCICQCEDGQIRVVVRDDFPGSIAECEVTPRQWRESQREDAERYLARLREMFYRDLVARGNIESRE